MTPAVKPRSYDASRRRAASAQTRRRILDTARARFLAAGYHTTTVADIATAAGVNVDTVYELAGRKPALLRELVEEAISGSDHPIAAEQRRYVAEIRAAATALDKIALYATAVRHIQERMAPLLVALRDAAAVDAEAANVWAEISERRAANMRLFAADVAGAGGLREGQTVESAADTVWVLNSAEVFVMLTRDRGWSPDRYEAWLTDTWTRVLLPDGAPAAGA